MDIGTLDICILILNVISLVLSVRAFIRERKSWRRSEKELIAFFAKNQKPDID